MADSSHCYLEDLYVSPESCSQGVAGSLIAEVKKIAIEQGSSELYWITRATNETAQKLYNKVATKTNFLRYEIKLGEK
jgi:ribosomal protein S18 acetylase RimI-like enzyme